MSNQSKIDYLLSVEWDDTVHRPSFVVHHRLTLPANMGREELETIIKDNILPQLKGTLTRAGAVARASLYRRAVQVPGRFLMLDTGLPNGVQNEQESFQLVARIEE